jgi:hypothetical protein
VSEVRYRQWAAARTNEIYQIAKRGVKRGAKGSLPVITQTPGGEACILATGRTLERGIRGTWPSASRACIGRQDIVSERTNKIIISLPEVREDVMVRLDVCISATHVVAWDGGRQ